MLLFSCRQKKSASSIMLFWRYCKDMQTYFRYFRHSWSHTAKMIVLTCRILQCLSSCVFLEILHFKESCNLIGQYFDSQLENQNCAGYGIGGEISITILFFVLDYFQEKLMIKFLKKSIKLYFGANLGPFCLNLGNNKILWKKRAASF